MFYIIYRNDIYGNFAIVGAASSLEECVTKRQVLGDLVVDEHGDLVISDEWLFDCEKGDESCYAKEMMQKGGQGIGLQHPIHNINTIRTLRKEGPYQGILNREFDLEYISYRELPILNSRKLEAV